MANTALTPAQINQTIKAVRKFRTISEAAIALGIPRPTLVSRINRARAHYAMLKKPFPLTFAPASTTRVDKLTADVDHLAKKAQRTAETTLREENTRLRQDMKRLTLSMQTLTDQARFEDRLLAEFRETLDANPYRQRLTSPAIRTGKGKADAHEMMVVISDAHYPEVVEPEAAFGLRYNADIAQRRIQHVRDKVLRYMELRRSAYPVRKLTIAVLGDMLSGNIHEELEVTNEQPMSKAVVDMSHILYDVGRSLAEHFPEVEMIVQPGNHPRLTKKPRFKQKWDNWEFAMGEFIKALAQKDFRVTVPRDLVYRHRIFDFVVGLTHGDGIKSASSFGLPWYSMKRRQDALQSLLKSIGQAQLDLLCYGHFHRMVYHEGQGCSLFINGSIKGGDEFSLGTGYSNEAPVQGLLTFHPKHGLTDLSRINLADIK